MRDNTTILKEKQIFVHGSKKIKIGDPSYFKALEAGSTNKNLLKLTFDGCISWAPIAKMKIQLQKVDYTSEYGDGSYKEILVTIGQSGFEKEVSTYLNGMYYPDLLAKKYQLGCDTAEFEFHTQYGSDLFHTGADGYYGDLFKFKRQHGMLLMLSFDADLFTFEEIEKRMLRLYPVNEAWENRGKEKENETA